MSEAQKVTEVSEQTESPAKESPPPSQLTITNKAAEKLHEFLEKEKKGPEFGLRLGVQGGGCSGLSYVMDFDTQKDHDRIFEHKGVRVFIDSKSILYLSGSELDFTDGLQGSGFSVKNPNQKGGCGCGQSFTT